MIAFIWVRSGVLQAGEDGEFLTVIRTAQAGAETAVGSVVMGVTLDGFGICVQVHRRGVHVGVVQEEAGYRKDFRVVENACGGGLVSLELLLDVVQDVGDTLDVGAARYKAFEVLGVGRRAVGHEGVMVQAEDIRRDGSASGEGIALTQLHIVGVQRRGLGGCGLIRTAAGVSLG